MPVLKKKFISGILNGKHYARVYKGSTKIVDNYVSFEYTLIENTDSNAISTHLPSFVGKNGNTITDCQEYVFTLVDGTITKNRNTPISQVASVKCYYNEKAYKKISFDGLNLIKTIDNLNITDNITDMSNMFNDCTNLQSINNYYNLINANSSEEILITAESGTYPLEINISTASWDTSNVTNMDYLFCG